MRQDLGLTLEQVGERLGRSHGAVRLWELGKRQPEVRDMARLAEIYDVPPGVIFDALLEMTREERQPSTAPTPTVVPVQGVVQAGIWSESQSDALEAWEIPSLVVPIPEMYRFARPYALIVRGESMNLVFPEGTYLVCVSVDDLGAEPPDGAYVIVQRTNTAGEIEATCKRLKLTPEGVSWLMPEVGQSGVFWTN